MIFIKWVRGGEKEEQGEREVRGEGKHRSCLGAGERDGKGKTQAEKLKISLPWQAGEGVAMACFLKG